VTEPTESIRPSDERRQPGPADEESYSGEEPAPAAGLEPAADETAVDPGETGSGHLLTATEGETGAPGAESKAPETDSSVLETESTVAESTDAESTVAESTEAESTEAESTVAESTEVESTVAESTEVESTVAESTEAESTEAESTVAESTEAESTEVESTEAESTEAESTVAESTEAETESALLEGEAPLPGGETGTDGAEPVTAPAGPSPSRLLGPGKQGDQRPRPRGMPRPPARPRTGGPPEPKPVPRPPQPATAATPVHDAQDAAQAASWGRVDEDGTVYVREAEGERVVGQYPGADAKEALAYYVVRFLDLQAQVALLEARLEQLTLKEIDQTIASLRAALEEPAAVGDLVALRGRLDRIDEAAEEKRQAAAAEREAARAEAVAARTALVEQAEEVAGTDPVRMQWKQAGERLHALLEEWKEAQRRGPRIDKPTEDQLWKRFSHARASFDRGRRQFFAEQEQRRAEAKAAKESLVQKAEQLTTSTDWGATAATFRSLMEQWKAAGRAAAKEDDALWERFRAAQDAFFAARNAASTASEAEFGQNLEKKLALLGEAEGLLPIKDLNRTRTALRSIQERWEAIGKVPRADVQRVEGRLRAIEQAVRDAQQQTWSRRNPETRARAEGAVAQLEASIATLESDLAAAEAQGDARLVKAARDALAARRAWLDQVRRTADEVR
jgi:hypothetical protein